MLNFSSFPPPEPDMETILKTCRRRLVEWISDPENVALQPKIVNLSRMYKVIRPSYYISNVFSMYLSVLFTVGNGSGNESDGSDAVQKLHQW
jgi:hypothetical protein